MPLKDYIEPIIDVVAPHARKKPFSLMSYVKDFNEWFAPAAQMAIDEYEGEESYPFCSYALASVPVFGKVAKPLAKVASGGELSRVMLALKTVLADKDEVESIIFDEIDTGISGRTAQKVSEKMALIGKNRQVICITHLPQIASMADTHFLIEKSVQGQSTITGIRKLKAAEEVEELARMLGGVEITDKVLENAQEMKSQAHSLKARNCQ